MSTILPTLIFDNVSVKLLKFLWKCRQIVDVNTPFTRKANIIIVWEYLSR